MSSVGAAGGVWMMERSLLQNVEEESVDFLKTIKNLLGCAVTAKFGCVVPPSSMLPEQVVGEHCPILHHSSCQTEHHVQTLVLESPIKAEGCWETCVCAVFVWPGLLYRGSGGCGAHCRADLLTRTSVPLASMCPDMTLVPSGRMWLCPS